MKTIVIYHKADFDGLFSKEIAKKALGDKAEYIGWDYGLPEPKVAPDDKLYIVDLSVDGLMGHKNLIWIDHHKSALEKYKNIPGFQIDGVAACRLCWQYFFEGNSNGELDKQAFVDRTVTEPLAVQLAGEYDIWDKRNPDTDLFQSGLNSQDLGPIWEELLELDNPGPVEKLIEQGGYVLYAKEQKDKTNILKYGFTVEFEGLTFLALNTAFCTSDSYIAGLKPEHEGCLKFNYNGKQWDVSLYGAPDHPDVDLSKIAVKHGGGGHKQACGFKAQSLPFVHNDEESFEPKEESLVGRLLAQ